MSLLVLGAILLGAIALSVAAMLGVRRFGSGDAVLTDSNHASAIFGVVGTAYAVILGFIMFFAFGSFSDAKNASGAEASAVTDMFRTSKYFRSVHDRAGGELICYGRAVIHQEWPAMDEDERSDVVAEWRLEIEETIRKIRPSGPSQGAAFGALLTERDRRSEARRQRLAEASPAVGPPVILILILGGVISTAFVLLFADRRESALLQAGQIAAMAAMVVSGLAVIWFLDHPYEGESGSIKPTEMERTVDNMLQESPEISPPCTETGLPRSATEI